MKIEWLGHSAFLLTSDKGTKILTDPYQANSYGGAISYEQITLAVDAVTISHSHPDHSYIDSLEAKPKVINQTGKFTVSDVTINGFNSFHDAQKGGSRGENIIFSFKIDQMNLVHLGDLGHSLEPNLISQIGVIDILLIPTGGTFTIGPKEAERIILKTTPKLVIPMHFKTKKIGFNLETVDEFLRITQFPKEISTSCFITVTKELLPKDKPRVLVLQHSH